MTKRPEYILDRCPVCKRLKRYDKWCRPIGKDLADIRRNWDYIKFVDDVCERCKDK